MYMKEEDHMEDETYNGWSNRETWAWNLVVSNDQYLEKHFVEVLVAEWTAQVEKFPGVLTDGVSPYAVGNWLKEAFNELIYDFQDNNEHESELMFRRDVGSLWRIDWAELGRHYMVIMNEYEGMNSNGD